MKRLLCVALVLLAGCATRGWVDGSGPYTSSSQKFSVKLPQGWMRANTEKFLLATRDGVLLQRIVVERLPVDKPLPHTKKTLAKGMLPQEVAEVALDDLASDRSVPGLTILENTPAAISGVPGFRAVFTLKNPDGLKIKGVYCGVLVAGWFYGIRYLAAERYYFDLDAATFEQVLQSFRIPEGA
jgi:hypothetical protein